jgi:hypothetical protein
MAEDRVWDAAVQILVGLTRNPKVELDITAPEKPAGTALSLAKALDASFSEHQVELDKERSKDPRFPVILKLLGIMLEEHERLRTSGKGKSWDYHQGGLDALHKAIDCIGGILSGKVDSIDFASAEPPPVPYKIEKLEKGVVKLVLWGAVDWASDKAHFEMLRLASEVEGGLQFDLVGVQHISEEWVRFLAALAALCEKRGKSFELQKNPAVWAAIKKENLTAVLVR